MFERSFHLFEHIVRFFGKQFGIMIQEFALVHIGLGSDQLNDLIQQARNGAMDRYLVILFFRLSCVVRGHKVSGLNRCTNYTPGSVTFSSSLTRDKTRTCTRWNGCRHRDSYRIPFEPKVTEGRCGKDIPLRWEWKTHPRLKRGGDVLLCPSTEPINGISIKRKREIGVEGLLP